MGAPAIAYRLADHVCALMASDEVKQRTWGMELAEFRDFLAVEMSEVLTEDLLDGDVVSPPLPKALRRADDFSNITDAAARQLLENAPVEVMRVYCKQLRNGMRAPAALQDALAEMRVNADASPNFDRSSA